jgi:hypothetical protein
MFSHPDRIGQLARENHLQMLAEASQRQLRHQHSQQTARTATVAATIIRRVTTAIGSARTSAVQRLRTVS